MSGVTLLIEQAGPALTQSLALFVVQGLLSGLVWLMSPAYPLTSVHNVMSNDPMFWAGLMLVITAITWAVQRANRTVDPRLCLGCGYNLTANTTGECSECGAVIPGDQRRYLGEWWA